MEIKKTHLNNHNFLFDPSIEETLIKDIDVDLSSKPNVFSAHVQNQPVLAPVEKPKNPIKRLNTMDNQFLLQDETGVNRAQDSNRLPQKDINLVWKAMKNVFRNIFIKVPVINYFMLREKQNKLKATINDLNSLNNSVDELIHMQFPREENFDKYKIISESLIKANSIHSQIVKEIQD